MDHTVHNMLGHRLSFADECMADDFGDDHDYPYDFASKVSTGVRMGVNGNGRLGAGNKQMICIDNGKINTEQ